MLTKQAANGFRIHVLTISKDRNTRHLFQKLIFMSVLIARDIERTVIFPTKSEYFDKLSSTEFHVIKHTFTEHFEEFIYTTKCLRFHLITCIIGLIYCTNYIPGTRPPSSTNTKRFERTHSRTILHHHPIIISFVEHLQAKHVL